MESMKATEMKEAFFCHTFLLFRDNRVFISFVSLKDRQGDKKAFAEGSGNCGDGWKTENGVLLFIYTPVITVSLASKLIYEYTSTCSLSLSSLPLLLFWCICAYFVYDLGPFPDGI